MLAGLANLNEIISANEVASFRFPRKILLKGEIDHNIFFSIFPFKMFVNIFLVKIIDYNHGHNIMRIFDVFQIFLSPQEIRKVQNNVKILWEYNIVSSIPPKKKILSILAKDSLKTEIEIFPECAISHKN